MQAYLDNSATTRCLERVTDKMVEVMRTDFGNPSSMHTKGVEAEKYIREAKTFFARNLKVQEKEIYFTSGGTESNNLALIGTAMANRRNGSHLITTCLEHASVSNPMKYLESQGFRVTYLPAGEDGVIRMEDLENALCDDTILVSVMYVNNETGAVQPVDEIGKLLKEQRRKIFFMWTQSRPMGNTGFSPRERGLISCPPAGTRFTVPREADFCMWTKR